MLSFTKTAGPPDGLPTVTEHSIRNESTSGTARPRATNTIVSYSKSLFPFTGWIGQYDSTWLASDLVAGITVGAVVVPQGMAYALLAKLEPQYGLYSSFVGAMIYWLFGTSRDISIGPVAVLSTVVGNVVDQVNSSREEPIEPIAIAAALSISTGVIVLAMGFARCGWIVDYIPITSLTAFTTGSALTIAAGQLPGLLGLDGFSNREAPYRVIANTLQNLGSMDANASLGLSALALLYALRFGLTTAAERLPKQSQAFNFLNTMRVVGVIMLYTLISWLLNTSLSSEPSFNILGSVPEGLPHFGVPDIHANLVWSMSSSLPAAVIVMLAEHIAIAKSFSRASHYTIDASQEMVAIGTTNLISPFFGGYPSTGSFSRTAIQSKAGARSPLAGVVTGGVVLFAVYFMTSVFFYIPNAVLSAVIIHAVIDLLASKTVMHHFWVTSRLEAGVFALGVVLSIFRGIEEALYVTIGISFMVICCHKIRSRYLPSAKSYHGVLEHDPTLSQKPQVHYGTFPPSAQSHSTSGTCLTSNAAGIVVHRLPAVFSFANSVASLQRLSNMIHSTESSQTQDIATALPGAYSASKPCPNTEHDEFPGSERLKAVVLDFTDVTYLDVTALQRVQDLREEMKDQDVSDSISWHAIGIASAAIARAVKAAGFELYDVDGAAVGV